MGIIVVNDEQEKSDQMFVFAKVETTHRVERYFTGVFVGKKNDGEISIEYDEINARVLMRIFYHKTLERTEWIIDDTENKLQLKPNPTVVFWLKFDDNLEKKIPINDVENQLQLENINGPDICSECWGVSDKEHYQDIIDKSGYAETVNAGINHVMNPFDGKCIVKELPCDPENNWVYEESKYADSLYDPLQF